MGGPLSGFDPAAGLTVPEGDPDGLEAAAGKFSGAGESLGGSEGTISSHATLASWQGSAASAYSNTASLAAQYTNQAGDACRAAARACKTLAIELRAAQEKARAAIAKAQAARDAVASLNAQWDAAMSSPPKERGPMLMSLGHQSGELRSYSSGLQSEVAEAHEQARAAARAAAAAFNDVAGMTPGAIARKTSAIVTAVRNGDYSALNGVPLNYLSEQAQLELGHALAADVGDEMDDGADEGRLADHMAILNRYRSDEEFTVGFFNELGGARTSELVQSVADSDSFFSGESEFFTDFAGTSIIAPLGFALATASHDDRLDNGYLEDFLGPMHSLAGPENYDVDAHWAMAALIYPTISHGSTRGVSRWDADFLYDVARKTVIDDAATGGPMGMPWTLEEDGVYDWRTIVLDAVAQDPEVAQRIVNGSYTAEMIADAENSGMYLEHSRFIDVLLRSGFSDQGHALGDVLLAATQRGDLLSADEAARNVILAVPGAAEHHGEFQEALYPALAEIATDHLGAFEYAALQVAEPGGGFALEAGEIGSAGGLDPLTYDQSHDFLVVLFKDGGASGTVQAAFATRIEGHVAEALRIDDGAPQASEEARLEMREGGALQELAALSAGHAMEGDALEQDRINGYAQFFVNEVKSVLMAKVDKVIERVPVASTVENYLTDKVLEQWFPTDNQIHAVREEDAQNVDLMLDMKHYVLMEQVARGELPPDALEAIQPNGNVDFAAVATGPFARPDSSGDVVGAFDFDRDGTAEVYTEARLREAVAHKTDDYVQEAWDYMVEIRNARLGAVLED